MKPFTVTSLQAAKMPRWLLLLLCGLYVVPGLIGRDPWRFADAAGFGVAWTMSLAPNGLLDWLAPNVLGMPLTQGGPLPAWLGAVAINALPFVRPDLVVRWVAIAWVGLLLLCLWSATWLVARRPEVQPADPFGASATTTDFGRAVADSALLIALASFGLLARLHETTIEAAQVVWIGLFLFGCAKALEAPRSGGAIAGLAIGLTVLTRGLPVAAALLLTVFILIWQVGAFRLVARTLLVWLTMVALAVALPWPLALGHAGEAGLAWRDAWLEWNASLVGGPTLASGRYALENLIWFFWPAWPIAGWALWRWRERRLEPAIAVPTVTAMTLLVAAMLSPIGTEAALLPIVPPLAMLAALGLPTIRRGLTSLIDWFAVMTFTLIGLALWAYWIAFQTGWPAPMAYRAQQSLLGFAPVVDPLEVLLGAAATVAWLTLVAWRISRKPRALWRSVVLSAGGVVLGWFLLMTLWLPGGNYRSTYRDVAQQAGVVVSTRHRCVRTLGLDAAQRATFAYFGKLRLNDDQPDCEWLLVADRADRPLTVVGESDLWRLAWRGQRPVDRRERFRLLRRVNN